MNLRSAEDGETTRNADCFVSQVFELHLFEGEASPDWPWWADAVRLVGGRTPSMVQFGLPGYWFPWVLSARMDSGLCTRPEPFGMWMRELFQGTLSLFYVHLSTKHWFHKTKSTQGYTKQLDRGDSLSS